MCRAGATLAPEPGEGQQWNRGPSRRGRRCLGVGAGVPGGPHGVPGERLPVRRARTADSRRPRSVPIVADLWPLPLAPGGQGAGLLWAPRPPPPHLHELHGLSIPITFPHHLAGLSGAPSAPGGPGTQRWARRPVSCFLWSSGCHHQQAHVGDEEARLTECSDLWQVPMPGRGAGAGAQAWELRPGRQPGAGPSPSMPSGVRGPHQMREWPRLCPSCPDPRPFAQAAPDPGHSPHALPAWPLHVEDSSANAGWCVTTSGQNGRHEDMSQSGSLLSGRGAPDGGGGWLGFRGEGCGVGRQVAAPRPPPAGVSGSWGNAARRSACACGTEAPPPSCPPPCPAPSRPAPPRPAVGGMPSSGRSISCPVGRLFFASGTLFSERPSCLLLRCI